MRDYSELELIAKAATGFSDVSLAPDVILELIAENRALRKNADRYQWLREPRSGFIEVVEWVGPHATGMTGEELDALLDGVMGKGEQV